MSVNVHLDPWDVDVAHRVGEQRNAANDGVKDAPHYDPKRMQDNTIAARASARCELGVAKFYGVWWDGEVWDRSDHSKMRHRPDVGSDVEVRRVRDRRNPLPVRERDVKWGKNMVLAYSDDKTPETVTIIGWIPAEDGWRIGSPAEWDRTAKTRLVNQSDLYDPTVLTVKEAA